METNALIRSAGPKTESFDLCLRGYGAPSSASTSNWWPGSVSQWDFSGAGVKDLEEYALAFAHLDGSVVAQQAAVDGTGDVVDHQRAIVTGCIVRLPIVQD